MTLAPSPIIVGHRVRQNILLLYTETFNLKDIFLLVPPSVLGVLGARTVVLPPHDT